MKSYLAQLTTLGGIQHKRKLTKSYHIYETKITLIDDNAAHGSV